MYDTNNNGVMEQEEFNRAVAGNIAADHVNDKWFDLPRDSNHISSDTLQKVCNSLSGLPKGPNEEVPQGVLMCGKCYFGWRCGVVVVAVRCVCLSVSVRACMRARACVRVYFRAK